jgi:hypothetical protein
LRGVVVVVDVDVGVAFKGRKSDLVNRIFSKPDSGNRKSPKEKTKHKTRDETGWCHLKNIF